MCVAQSQLFPDGEQRGKKERRPGALSLEEETEAERGRETCYSLFIKVRGLDSGFQPLSVLGRTGLLWNLLAGRVSQREEVGKLQGKSP